MGSPSEINDRIAQSYADYLVAFQSIREAATNMDDLCCADCVRIHEQRLKTWNDKAYTLNIPSYKDNAFFLGYKSDRYSGILVDGKLLTDEDIANTKRQFTENLTITTPKGNDCVRILTPRNGPLY